ncbi:hypothetical protein OG738_13565 [Amycolatopsis sp. NBC_01488]|uniref:hypothetical protein n=1 Tax=Amycolatopsis sp. NBC_01488 TaxID=2903563 RepID=UPI002E2AE466|nr:hypothetical protein [Amycolatopsis sp. NBC_01488]
MKGLAPGYWVGIALREPVSGSRYWVGEVQELDDHGLRLTLIDWIVGTATGWDFYVPWDNVLGAHVATPEHDLRQFGEEAGQFQTRHNEASSTEDKREDEPSRQVRLVKAADIPLRPPGDTPGPADNEP